MRRYLSMILLAAAAAAAFSGCAVLRVGDAARVSSGLTGHLVCSGTFISGQDPDHVYAEAVRLQPGMGLVDWALRYRVDTAQRQVITTIAGGFESRAVYHDGLGCLVLQGDAPDPGPLAYRPSTDMPALLPEIAGPAPVEPTDAAMRAALDAAFAEPASPQRRNTHAVVVLRDGKVIAERYAPGYGIDTPLHGMSMTKSMMHALIGVLVRDGKLEPDQPAPLPAWRGAEDARRTITIDHLLRQTAGLDFAQTNTGFDPTSRMTFVERDPAAFAVAARTSAAPGTRWDYTDGHFALLSRIVRDAVGGRPQDVLDFAQRELWGPLGMRHVTLEFDATGTPMGAGWMYASARDWARFGQLYLNDGVAGGRRILPEGWVRHAATPTLDTGYGAGFFTNAADGKVPAWGVPWGLPSAPRDTFFARGYRGQFVIVIPSERMVIVRLGHAAFHPAVAEGNIDRVVHDVLAAVRAHPSLRCGLPLH